MPAIIAKAGNIATIAKKKDPGKVIFEMIPSKNSAVFFPGLIPGIKPPFFLRSSAICCGEKVIAV